MRLVLDFQTISSCFVKEMCQIYFIDSRNNQVMVQSNYNRFSCSKVCQYTQISKEKLYIQNKNMKQQISKKVVLTKGNIICAILSPSFHIP